MQLTKLDEHIWIYNGSTVKFFAFPYSTRMTVIQLRDGDLWIHSPEKLNKALQDELNNLSKVRYLISPNKLHHLFLLEWICAYPDAERYAAPGLAQKRRDIVFTKELSNQPEKEWEAEIDQVIFQGSAAMEEVVFFHLSSRTLILTDLIENFEPAVFNWWQKPFARATGILAPNGKTPIDWRASFVFGKKKARAALDKMLQWQPANIVISHGECVFGNGKEFLERSFSWLR